MLPEAVKQNKGVVGLRVQRLQKPSQEAGPSIYPVTSAFHNATLDVALITQFPTSDLSGYEEQW